MFTTGQSTLLHASLLAFCTACMVWNPLKAQGPSSKAVQQLTANPTPTQTGAAVAPQTLRVLSYNIHHAEGVDGRLDVERIAKTILSVRPDVVALQEVDLNVKRSGNVDQPKELARLTNMQVAFGGNIDLEGGKYGNALLTRGQITKSENHSLPNVAAGEQRGVLEVSVSHQGRDVRVFATHLDHRRDQTERMQSIKVINEMALSQPDRPTLLIGDLNAEYKSEVLDRAREVWSVPNDRHMVTIPVAKPDRQIDFILTFPTKRWRATEVKVLDEVIASDHRAIMAELEF